MAETVPLEDYERLRYERDCLEHEKHVLQTYFARLQRELEIERYDLECARELSVSDDLTLNLMDGIQNCLDAVDKYASRALA